MHIKGLRRNTKNFVSFNTNQIETDPSVLVGLTRGAQLMCVI